MVLSKLGETSDILAEGLIVVELPSGKELHKFDNPQIDKPYLIEWETDELTSLCPVTGHPDFCQLEVRCIPSSWCAELKSVKFYIESFRNEGHFYEQLINMIYTDFDYILDPQSLQISGLFNIRGGIPQRVTVGTIDYELL